MQTVIFACVHNAGRSQMAAAFFNQLADRSKAQAVSQARTPVCGYIQKFCRYAGSRHDLSDAKPQKLTEELAKGAVCS